MALTIVLEKVVQLGGGVKKAYYKVSDSDGGGGTLDVSGMFSHLLTVNIQNMVSATWISGIWTEDAESITIGAEGASSDVYKVVVEGY